MFGSVTNLVILKNSHCFDKRTCFYLQALSVTDMLYLTFMIGYLVASNKPLYVNLPYLFQAEVSIFHNMHSTNYDWKKYLTHWSVILSNTFVTSSSGIILLVTIEYYKSICTLDMSKWMYKESKK